MLGLGGQYSFQGIHVRTDSVNMEIDYGLLAFRTFLFITLNISHQYIRDFFADNKGATLKDAIRWPNNLSGVIGEGPNSFRAARIPAQSSGNPSFQEVQSLLWHNRLPALSEPCCGQHLR